MAGFSSAIDASGRQKHKGPIYSRKMAVKVTKGQIWNGPISKKIF